MHFTFGYTREVPVKMEKETSFVALIAIAILVVLLFILLSFENIDGRTLTSCLSFHAPSSSTQMGLDSKLENDSKIYPEQNLRRSELKNSSRLWRDSQSR